MSLYQQLVKNGTVQCEFEMRGLLYAYRDKTRFDAYSTTDQLLTEKFGHPAERYEGDRILELEPALRPGLAGGWYYRADAHLRPDALMRSWRKHLETSGVRIIDQTEAGGFVRQSGRASAIQTPGGLLTADAFVVATGAWTPLLAKQLGCAIPIQPGKGYSITMPRPRICPNIPMIFPETRVAVTPWASGYRLGSTMEFAGYDTTINRARLALLRDGAEPYLREAHCEPVQEEWYGWRPMTYDSLPIIGPSPVMENVMIAAGHNMVGISMAPATGKLVAELMCGVRPHIDPGAYRPTRF
jgi:D-amino-acid dehydrogenase